MNLEQEIYDKYIKPTQRKRGAYVGIEFELPIVNMNKQPVDFAVVHRLTDAFIEKFHYDVVNRDEKGDIYLTQSSANGDGLSYDCSYNTLELSFGVETDLNVVYNRFVDYYSFIQAFLEPYHYTLTGMGVNPYYTLNHNEPIPNGRYRMLFHHLQSYTKYGEALNFHHYPNFGMFSCASQVQLDVEENHLVETLNTFNKLEPLKSLLFANSLWGKEHEILCVRDQMWKNSLHGLNPHNVDMYEAPFKTVDTITEYIKSMSLYCVERGEKYINFAPIPLEEYFSRKEVTGEYYGDGAYHTITFQPQKEDMAYLRSFKLEDLTYRGTVEFRSACAQPMKEAMTPAAFHTGLLENLPALTKLLQEDSVIYHHGYDASQLRQLFNYRIIPDGFNKRELSALLFRILDIAKDGLEKRGQGETRFLIPLYTRAEQLLSPARQMAEGLDRGQTLEHYIHQFAIL
jgi:gamma-glutamylcysteine synthetase